MYNKKKVTWFFWLVMNMLVMQTGYPMPVHLYLVRA